MSQGCVGLPRGPGDQHDSLLEGRAGLLCAHPPIQAGPHRLCQAGATGLGGQLQPRLQGGRAGAGHPRPPGGGGRGQEAGSSVHPHLPLPGKSSGKREN